MKVRREFKKFKKPKLKWPKIKFVDEMPELYGVPVSNDITGRIYYPSMEIYIKKMKGDKLVLMHELLHYVVYVLSGPKSGDNKVHDFIDKYLTIEQLKD